MEKIMIYGAGGTGKALYNILKEKNIVVAFIDTFKSGTLDGIEIIKPRNY